MRTENKKAVKGKTVKSRHEDDSEDDDEDEESESKMGHNSGGVSGARIKAFIERIERLEEEKSALSDDIKDIYAESKAVGFDNKTIRKLIRLRKMDKEKRREEEEMLELYKSAIGLE